MNGPSGWDVALYGAAALVAVWWLVRLMRQRRDQLIADVQQQIDEQRARNQEASDDRNAA